LQIAICQGFENQLFDPRSSIRRSQAISPQKPQNNFSVTLAGTCSLQQTGLNPQQASAGPWLGSGCVGEEEGLVVDSV
jgi:hypothetical protein